MGGGGGGRRGLVLEWQLASFMIETHAFVNFTQHQPLSLQCAAARKNSSGITSG